MMHAIKQSRFINPVEPTYPWYIVGSTISRSSAWAFDRWRLYMPAEQTEVAIFFVEDPTQPFIDGNGEFVVEPTLIQPFSTTLSFEHDFTFDLSSFPAHGAISNHVFIGMRTPPENSKFQQIYCYPTGWGATRGKNAQIRSWDFSRFGVGDGIGLDIGRLRFNNQPIQQLDWAGPGTPKIFAKDIYFVNSQLNSTGVDQLINWTNNAGLSGGSMNYYGIPEAPTAASRASYDALKSRSWIITGTAPPIN